MSFVKARNQLETLAQDAIKTAERFVACIEELLA